MVHNYLILIHLTYEEYVLKIFLEKNNVGMNLFV